MPGYSKDSKMKEVAPVTPSATTSEADITARQSIESDREISSNEIEPEQHALYRDETQAHVESSPSPPLSAHSTASTSGYMAPPLPLKIRTDRSAPSSPGLASSGSNPTPLAGAVDLPQVGTPTRSMTQEESITSPGGESRASTTVAYDIPSMPNSPKQHVTFASETQEHPATPLAKSTMSGKFAAGLKLKGWSGKNSQKENGTSPSQTKESVSPGQSKEPAKSPLPGLKGFKWWQKDGNTQPDESSQSEFNSSVSF